MGKLPQKKHLLLLETGSPSAWSTSSPSCWCWPDRRAAARRATTAGGPGRAARPTSPPRPRRRASASACPLRRDGHDQETEDLCAMLRNLLDDAVRYTRHRVLITAGRQPDGVVVEIADDGPGAQRGKRQQYSAGFVRLDARRGSRPAGRPGSGWPWPRRSRPRTAPPSCSPRPRAAEPWPSWSSAAPAGAEEEGAVARWVSEWWANGGAGGQGGQRAGGGLQGRDRRRPQLSDQARQAAATMAERSRPSASARAPASDGSSVSPAARTGTCGRAGDRRGWRRGSTGWRPHEPPMTTSSGSASATMAARTPLMARPRARRVAAAWVPGPSAAASRRATSIAVDPAAAGRARRTPRSTAWPARAGRRVRGGRSRRPGRRARGGPRRR